MNKGFGIVWSQVSGAYVVTSEIAKAYGKKSARTFLLKKKVGLLALVLCTSPVWGKKDNEVNFSVIYSPNAMSSSDQVMAPPPSMQKQAITAISTLESDPSNPTSVSAVTDALVKQDSMAALPTPTLTGQAIQSPIVESFSVIVSEIANIGQTTNTTIVISDPFPEELSGVVSPTSTPTAQAIQSLAMKSTPELGVSEESDELPVLAILETGKEKGTLPHDNKLSVAPANIVTPPAEESHIPLSTPPVSINSESKEEATSPSLNQDQERSAEKRLTKADIALAEEEKRLPILPSDTKEEAKNISEGQPVTTDESKAVELSPSSLHSAIPSVNTSCEEENCLPKQVRPQPTTITSLANTPDISQSNYSQGEVIGSDVIIVDNNLTIAANSALPVNILMENGTNLVFNTEQELGVSDLTLQKAATLNFVDAQGIFSSTLAGEGRVNVDQASHITLAQDNDSSGFTGKTAVAGTLVVNGELGGEIEVQPAARLQGRGKMDRVIVQSGGTFAPGTSIGNPTIKTYMKLEDDSTLEVEIAPDGSSDRVTVEGQAELGRTHLVVIGDGSSAYKVGTHYTILTAEEGISGEFADMTQKALPFIDLTLTQDKQNIYLEVTRNGTAFAEAAANSHHAAVATALTTLVPGGAGGGLYELISSVPTIATARQAFDLLSGEIYASSQSFLLNDSHHVREAMMTRLRGGGDKALQDQPTVWGQGYGGWGRYAATDQAAKLGYHQQGALLGTEGVAGNWHVGVLGGYGHSHLKLNDRHSRSKVASYHLGLYTGTLVNGWNIRLGSAYSGNKAEVTRHFPLNGQELRNSADYRAHTLQFFGELGYQLKTDTAVVEPLLNVAYVKAKNQAFQEKGSVLTALHSDSHQNHVTFSTLGMRATQVLASGESEVALQAELGWRHAYGDLTPGTRLSFTGSDTFVMGGVPIAKDMAVLGLGATMKVAKYTNVEFNYGGAVAKKAQEHHIQANIVWKF